ncbi:hypothetical protein [Methanobrevibacter arboriphilus]|uniref:hypothetical protein n=1 Tax=Methanobrevibacter arboriphilus TaxID=39441 RepID=UPI0006D141BA|nr:hypothetical protein [Methanobrevibacter arboriphilus]
MFKYLILFVVIIVVAIVGIFAAGTLMSYLNPAQETIDSINQTKNNITSLLDEKSNLTEELKKI